MASRRPGGAARSEGSPTGSAASSWTIPRSAAAAGGDASTTGSALLPELPDINSGSLVAAAPAGGPASLPRAAGELPPATNAQLVGDLEVGLRRAWSLVAAETPR